MVYDNTDVSSNLRDIQRGAELPFGWEMPDIDIPVGLTWSWFAGGHLYRHLGRIDDYFGAGSWQEAFEYLAIDDTPVSQIQYWGHGSPGRAFLDKEFISKDVCNGRYGQLLERIKRRLTKDAVIWFRTCATFGGRPGVEFAQGLADDMECRIAGHTFNIGPIQAGLHTLGPGEGPIWDESEGIDLGMARKPRKMKSSKWSSPNRVTFLHSQIPDGW